MKMCICSIQMNTHCGPASGYFGRRFVDWASQVKAVMSLVDWGLGRLNTGALHYAHTLNILVLPEFIFQSATGVVTLQQFTNLKVTCAAKLRTVGESYLVVFGSVPVETNGHLHNVLLYGQGNGAIRCCRKLHVSSIDFLNPGGGGDTMADMNNNGLAVRGFRHSLGDPHYSNNNENGEIPDQPDFAMQTPRHGLTANIHFSICLDYAYHLAGNVIGLAGGTARGSHGNNASYSVHLVSSCGMQFNQALTNLPANSAGWVIVCDANETSSTVHYRTALGAWSQDNDDEFEAASLLVNQYMAPGFRHWVACRELFATPL